MIAQAAPAQQRDVRLMVLGLALLLAALIGLIALVSIRWGSRRLLRPAVRTPAAAAKPVSAWEEAARRVAVPPTTMRGAGGSGVAGPAATGASFEPFGPELALDADDDADLDDTEDDFGSSGGTTGFDFDGDDEDSGGGRPRG